MVPTTNATPATTVTNSGRRLGGRAAARRAHVRPSLVQDFDHRQRSMLPSARVTGAT